MVDIYGKLAAASWKIAEQFPPPRFYSACSKELSRSYSIFARDELVLRCRKLVLKDLQDNLGHGLDHAQKVAVEAGALVLVEGASGATRGFAGDEIEVLTLAQMAGLLHDVRRGEKEHAGAGAKAAEKILRALAVSRDDTHCIVEAIANHEAFVEPKKMESPLGQMISNVLYDADKFRWGPDNFTVTLWEMLRARKIPIAVMIRRYPEGMAGIAHIKDTFRSEPGKVFGPEFIDLGLAMGEKIYEFLRVRFAEELKSDAST